MTLGTLLAKYDDNASVRFKPLILAHDLYSTYNSILSPIHLKNYIYKNINLVIASQILIQHFVIKIQNLKKNILSNHINN